METIRKNGKETKGGKGKTGEGKDVSMMGEPIAATYTITKLIASHNAPRPALKLSPYADVKYPSPKSVAVSPHVIKDGASTQTTHWEFDVIDDNTITSAVKLLM